MNATALTVLVPKYPQITRKMAAPNKPIKVLIFLAKTTGNPFLIAKSVTKLTTKETIVLDRNGIADRRPFDSICTP
jgi:hypothetical protein